MNKKIVGYEQYTITKSGIVLKGNKIIKHFINKKSGQHRVSLTKNGIKKNFLVSRLVYCTYNNIDINYNFKNLICHKDDNLNNNNLYNLFLGTQSDNMIDCKNKGRLIVPKYIGTKNPNSKLDDYKVVKIKKLYSIGYTYKQISYEMNISKSTVFQIITGKTRTHVSL